MKPSHILFATGIVALTVQVSAWMAAPVITQRYVRLQHVNVGTLSKDADPDGQGQSDAPAPQPRLLATVLHQEEAR